jgi:hypothetical protein
MMEIIKKAQKKETPPWLGSPQLRRLEVHNASCNPPCVRIHAARPGHTTSTRCTCLFSALRGLVPRMASLRVLDLQLDSPHPPPPFPCSCPQLLLPQLLLPQLLLPPAAAAPSCCCPQLLLPQLLLPQLLLPPAAAAPSCCCPSCHRRRRFPCPLLRSLACHQGRHYAGRVCLDSTLGRLYDRLLHTKRHCQNGPRHGCSVAAIEQLL